MTLQDVWCSPISLAVSAEGEAGGFCFGATWDYTVGHYLRKEKENQQLLLGVEVWSDAEVRSFLLV